MIKESRHYNLILGFLGDCLSLTFQIQYYNRKEYKGERHWGVGLGLCVPPFMLITGGDAQ